MATTNNENLISNSSYTEKDFQSIYPALLDLVKKLTSKWDPSTSNESDPGVLLLKLNAIIADKCNYNIDKNVLECFPLSVTQEENARQLFEQLGYYMHWYKSAETVVALKWIGERYDTDGDGEYNTLEYKIPRFTMVCDTDKEVVYTITDSKTLKDNGTVQTFNAVQGIATAYEINGNKLITTANLDTNNRLYFTDTRISENGIFICNAGADNYSSWIRKDNLLVEKVSSENYFYKFGISQDLSTCYIEFPENCEELFQDGINITYLVTDGLNGNIAAYALEKFYADVTTDNPDTTATLKTVSLTTDNVSIKNYFIGSGGLDQETINDAYLGYKKTVGTFETLITLRDYMNAIAKSDYVSNALVCDRTNDPQSSYDIMTKSGSINQPLNEVEIDTKYNVVGYYDGADFWETKDSAGKYSDYIEPDEDKNYLDLNTNKPYRYIKGYYASSSSVATDTYVNAEPREKYALNAFDLKLYLLATTGIINSATTFNKTFDLTLDETIQAIIEGELEEQKIVQHSFEEVLPNKICFIKNKYPINCTIIPQYQVTEAQAAEISTNIRKALWNNLNSSKLTFGEEISYETVYNIILDADTRIKAVALDRLTYDSYAVWVPPGLVSADGTKCYEETLLGTYSTYYKKTALLKTKLTALDVGTTTIKLGVVNADNEIIGTAEGIKVAGTGSNFKVSLIKYNLSPLEEMPIYQNNKWVDNPSTGTLSVWQRLKFIDDLDGVKDTSFRTWLDANVDSLTYDKDTDIALSSSTANDYMIDIYAKSVLAGKTQFFIKDTDFDYGINQKYQLLERSIGKLDSEVDITFNTANDWTYQLRENELISIYAPNLLEYTTFGYKTRWEYFIPKAEGSTDNVIVANTAYKLREGEYIGCYVAADGDDNAGFNYYIYGKGTIIQPSFNITRNETTKYTIIKDSSLGPNGKSLAENCVEIHPADLQNQTYYYTTGNSMDTEKYSALSAAIQKLTDEGINGNVLSSNRSIKIMLTNSISLESTSDYCYWILNQKENDRYYLFKPGDDYDYILKAGEFFIYTNSNRSDMNILGAGTKITRSSAFDNEYLYVEAIDYSQIVEGGILVLTDYWKNPCNKTEFAATSRILTITEMQYNTFSEGVYVEIKPKSSTSTEPITLTTEPKSLENYTIKYRESLTDAWTVVPDIVTGLPAESSMNNWSGGTSLRLESSTGTPQEIKHGQKLTYYFFNKVTKKTESEPGGVIDPADPTSPFYTSDTAYLLTSRLINNVGGKGISTIIYNDNDEPVPVDIYAYILGTMDDDVKFLDNGSTMVTFQQHQDPDTQAWLPYSQDPTPRMVTFRLPAGDYIMPVYHSTGNDDKGKPIINKLEIYMQTSDKDPSKAEDWTLLKAMGNESLSNLYKDGNYYLRIDNLPEGEVGTFFIRVKVVIHYTKAYSDGTWPIVSVIIPPIFKYSNSEDIESNKTLNAELFRRINDRLKELDYHELFDYTYTVDPDYEVAQPLKAISYLDPNHIMNPYTISQLDTAKTAIHVSNTIKE